MSKSAMLDRLRLVADDENGVSGAGLLTAATLGQRLGLGQLLSERVTVPGSAGAHPEEKCLTVIHGLLAGADCIDDLDVLRAGSSAAVLGHRVAAPSTVGTFLRAGTYGHARQLDVVAGQLFARAAAIEALPAAAGAEVFVDIDATHCVSFGLGKQGAMRVGRTGRRSYHPLIAVLAGGGDVVHARLRRGRSNDATGAPSFVTETINRLRAAGLGGGSDSQIVLRADSGFYLHDVVAACRAADVRFSVTARMLGGRDRGMGAAIAAIPEQAWTPIDYFLPGAGVAEIAWTPFTVDHRGVRRHVDPVRLIVRRTPRTDELTRNLTRRRATRPGHGGSEALFPLFDYHPMITDREGDLVAVEADHRRHAEVELTIRDLKYGMGLNHMPTKSFAGNAAWLTLNVIAHNLARWIARLGTGQQHVMTKTVRTRLFATPGRLVHTGRTATIRIPRRWPWAQTLTDALHRLRALPAPAT